MKRLITLLIVAVLMLGLLAGCQAEDGLPLSAEKDLEIRQAYADQIDSVDYTADDLSLRAVWCEDGIYAVYVDGPFGYTQAVRDVVIGEYGNMFLFTFPDGQRLYIYKDNSIYTLEEAYAAGILQTKHLESLQIDDAYANIRIPPNMDELSPEARKDLEIRQAYADRRGSWYNASELTLRIVWQRDDIYALYVDGPFGYMDAVEIIAIEGLKFVFPDSQQLYIYVDGQFYTLREAYENSVLTKEDLESLHKDDVYRNIRFPNAEP